MSRPGRKALEKMGITTALEMVLFYCKMSQGDFNRLITNNGWAPGSGPAAIKVLANELEVRRQFKAGIQNQIAPPDEAA